MKNGISVLYRPHKKLLGRIDSSCQDERPLIHPVRPWVAACAGPLLPAFQRSGPDVRRTAGSSRCGDENLVHWHGRPFVFHRRKRRIRAAWHHRHSGFWRSERGRRFIVYPYAPCQFQKYAGRRSVAQCAVSIDPRTQSAVLIQTLVLDELNGPLLIRALQKLADFGHRFRMDADRMTDDTPIKGDLSALL